MKRFTIAQIETALRSQAGIQAAAARALAELSGKPVSRQTINAAIKRSPRLQRACKEAQEFALDMAENVVIQAIQAQDLNAAKFLLETCGKHRGYSRRVEATMTANVNVNITVTDARRAFYDELDAMVARRRSVLGRRVIGNEPPGAGPVSEETQH